MTSVTAQPFIVYCDDDQDDLFLVRESLEACTTEVVLHTFDYAPEAFRFLEGLQERGTNPSLVILDINMHPLDTRAVKLF